jgi:hypothetical protein
MIEELQIREGAVKILLLGLYEFQIYPAPE